MILQLRHTTNLRSNDKTTYQNVADLNVSNWKSSAFPEAVSVLIGISKSMWYCSMYRFQKQLEKNIRTDKQDTISVLCLEKFKGSKTNL